ncbi:magnesium chelatase, subunit ChlI family protein [Rhodococcus sp. MTM3W5.2]|nr:magnesium chelatase, subunit ChlI family protein [Rhodococcus sp. MTM3W5.2]
MRYPAAFVVAWTLADLAGLAVPGEDQVGCALGYRDRRGE